jgi:hypothetical protein
MNELEQELAAIPAQMAQQVAAFLPSATVEGYTAFLHTMYHYTLQSQGRLARAAAAATDDPLRAFLKELADEEAHHYRLAEADLRAFGLTPSPDKPPSVAAFERAWEELPHDHAAAWVGALLALESVGDHIGPAALPALARLGLGKTQARFVLVHLEADVEHGAKCRDHALALAASHPALVLQGARAAAHAWVEMHRCLAG